MDLTMEGVVAYSAYYIDTMPAAILRGDIFALTITLIAFFAAIVIINKLTGMLIIFLKKVFLFIIVSLAFWQFLTMFVFRISAEGVTNDTLVFGAAGLIAGFAAISVSLYVALHSYYEARVHAGALPCDGAAVEGAEIMAGPGVAPVPVPMAVTTPAPGLDMKPVTSPEGPKTISPVRETLSVSSLRSDKSLGVVFAYLIVAQFGVFSSKTIPAPTFQVGVAFFSVFLIAGLFFIHFTYNNYRTGLRHLLITVILGTIIALVLGYFWAGIPLDILFSPSFFQTDALVALVTGLALSLFMGGKG